jgi:uncharacterized protein with FMN-binding domain
MPLKNTILSAVAITLFASYAAYEHVHQDSAGLVTLVMNDLAGTQSSVASTRTAPVDANAQPAAPASQPVAPQQIPAVTYGEDGGYGEGEDDGYSRRVRTAKPSQPTAAPAQQTPASTQSAAPVASKGQYKDGSYTGPSVNVYYGYVQVKAVISGGKIADVQFLQYPSDRQTSVMINTQAMPLLKQEAIAAQSASVSGVSGATETSGGFIQSLDGALTKARV